MSNGASPGERDTHASRTPGGATIVTEDKRDTTLSHEDAIAGCPEDFTVVGEEDAGIGIEFLVWEAEHGAPEPACPPTARDSERPAKPG